MKLMALYDAKKNKIYALEVDLSAKLFDKYETTLHLSDTKAKKVEVTTRAEFDNNLTMTFIYSVKGHYFTKGTIVTLDDNLVD